MPKVYSRVTWPFQPVTTRFFKHCSARMIHWEAMGLLIGYDGLLLGLSCDARDSRLYPEGLKRGGYELSGDDTECSVLAAFQPVQSGWGQLELQGWGSVVDDTEMKGPIDFERLTFSPAPPFGGK